VRRTLYRILSLIFWKEIKNGNKEKSTEQQKIYQKDKNNSLKN
jgi:hypothetical protein